MQCCDARDMSANRNQTAFSSESSATTQQDMTKPTPDPMQWQILPIPIGPDAIEMTAAAAWDVSGVEYYFEETSGNTGGSDSGWQDEITYIDTELQPSTEYTYRVKARDKSLNHNETALSTPASATTAGASGIPDGAVLWLKADDGVTTNASGVTGWTDQAGGDNNAYIYATWSSGYAQLENVTFPNGDHPAIYFDNNAVFRIYNENDLNLTEITIYAVLGPFGAGGVSDGVVICNWTNAPEQGWSFQRSGSGANMYWWTDGAVYDRYWTNAPDPPFGYHYITALLSMSQNRKEAYVDGTFSVQHRDNSSGWDATYISGNHVSIGSLCQAGTRLEGHLAELIVYPEVDDEKQTQVELYLYNKYWGGLGD